MEREIPTPGPIKVLRFPADGTPPHLLTLETLIADPPPEISRSQIGYYHTMLEHLLDNDLVRHVPNVRVFWTPKGWEQRCVVKFRYTNKTTPDLNGGYCLLMTDAEEGLQANRYLSNEKDTYFGDAFVLKEVGYHWLPGADLKDTVGCLLELRHEHLFPEYENVPQGILGSSILEVIRKDCFDNHVKPEGPAAGSASGVPVSTILCVLSCDKRC